MVAEFLLLVDKNGPIPEFKPNWGQLDRCWIWTGGSCRRFGDQRPHRVAYKLLVGPIPKDKPFVCHKCDFNHFLTGGSVCVNPNHLFAGSPADNSHDRNVKGRTRGGPTSAGATQGNKTKLVYNTNPWQKLTLDQVKEIREECRIRGILHKWGLKSRFCSEFAVKYAVCPCTIKNIIMNLTWT